MTHAYFRRQKSSGSLLVVSRLSVCLELDFDFDTRRKLK